MYAASKASRGFRRSFGVCAFAVVMCLDRPAAGAAVRVTIADGGVSPAAPAQRR
jgi:hypothetical protein